MSLLFRVVGLAWQAMGLTLSLARIGTIRRFVFPVLVWELGEKLLNSIVFLLKVDSSMWILGYTSDEQEALWALENLALDQESVSSLNDIELERRIAEYSKERAKWLEYPEL